MAPPLPRLRHHGVLLGFLAAALAWRLALALRFYGWEEDDYANLARSFAVATHGLGELSVSHLPLYYLVNAALIRVFGHAEVVCVATSMACGLVAMALAMRLARRAAGPLAEVLTGALLLVQPEFALYASSSLREPMYAALGLAGVWWIVQRRPLLAALALIGAMLVRAEAIVAFWPGYAFLLLGRGRGGRRGFAVGVVLLTAAFALGTWWAKVDSGSWLLFAPQLQANLDTGGVASATPLAERLVTGVFTVAGLAVRLLPWKVGHPFLLLALWAVVQVVRRRLWNRAAIVVAAFFVFNLAIWLGMGFVFQHALTHNLYWKWLYPTVPLLAVAASAGAVDVVDRLGGLGAGAPRRWALRAALALSLVWFAGCAIREYRIQIARADLMFWPQMALAREIERVVPDGTAIIVDHIPAAYLSRREHPYELISWFDLAEESADGDAAWFDEMLAARGVRFVLWFAEDWTHAPQVAPFLGGREPVILDSHHLIPRVREDVYGWVWYEVQPAWMASPGGDATPLEEDPGAATDDAPRATDGP